LVTIGFGSFWGKKSVCLFGPQKSNTVFIPKTKFFDNHCPSLVTQWGPDPVPSWDHQAPGEGGGSGSDNSPPPHPPTQRGEEERHAGERPALGSLVAANGLKCARCGAGPTRLPKNEAIRCAFEKRRKKTKQGVFEIKKHGVVCVVFLKKNSEKGGNKLGHFDAKHLTTVSLMGKKYRCSLTPS